MEGTVGVGLAQKKSASFGHAKLALELFTGLAGCFSYSHLMASATTTKPAVVQQDSRTWLLPAFMFQLLSNCQEPPLLCWFFWTVAEPEECATV